MESSKGRIASLDGLRAVSILMVLLGHSLEQSQSPLRTIARIPYLGSLFSYADFGVIVFFVISGFLITYLLLNEREKKGTISLRTFYTRRAFRILPASYAAIFVVAIVCHNSLKFRDVLLSSLYLQNFNPNPSWSLAHMWSLAVEEQFYLLWPFLLRRYFRYRYKIVISAMLIAPLFRAACGKLGFHHLETVWFPCAMDALATGCLLALLVREKDINWSAADRWFIPALEH